MKHKKIIVIIILVFILLGLIICYVVKNSDDTDLANYGTAREIYVN